MKRYTFNISAGDRNYTIYVRAKTKSQALKLLLIDKGEDFEFETIKLNQIELI